jgi:hypothetical protein
MLRKSTSGQRLPESCVDPVQLRPDKSTTPVSLQKKPSKLRSMFMVSIVGAENSLRNSSSEGSIGSNVGSKG